jgi:carboxyl-terminal processing protease
MRKKKILDFTLTRDAIVVKNVAAKTYNATTCYMSIGMFGYGVYDEFVSALTSVFGKDKCKKYIFDVRNNPGGSLEEVANILDYFVPTGKATVFVDSKL